MTRQERTVAMIDLAGFTALTEAHGDEHAADLAVEFADLARANLGPHDQLVKAIGDAVLLASPTPRDGLELVHRILTGCHAKDGFLVTRTGLHHGPVTIRSGDYFGAAVNLTARLAAHAAAGQVLGTGLIATAAHDLGLRVDNLGETMFKNVADPVGIHAVDLAPTLEIETIDPMCRMRVDHHSAAGYLRHEGTEHWFCSLACARGFIEQCTSAQPGD